MTSPSWSTPACAPDTIAESLRYADAAIVGTSFKRDGKFENHAQASRVAELMAVAKALR